MTKNNHIYFILQFDPLKHSSQNSSCNLTYTPKSLPYSSYTRRDGKRKIGLSEYIKLLENDKENLNLDNKESAIRSVPASVENSTQTKGAEMGSSRVLP